MTLREALHPGALPLSAEAVREVAASRKAVLGQVEQGRTNDHFEHRGDTLGQVLTEVIVRIAPGGAVGE